MFHVPDPYKKFVTSVKNKCRYHKVNFLLSPSKSVILTDDFQNECSGYFDDSIKALVVACGKPTEEWIQILIHESSHLDQWISDPRWNEWTKSCELLWTFMDGTRLLNKLQVKRVIDSMIELELDCEMRSVEKIRKWKLPISIDQYIRKSNAYLYSYRLIGEYKAFPTGVYYDQAVVNACPKTFQKDYSHIPDQLHKELDRFFQNLKRA